MEFAKQEDTTGAESGGCEVKKLDAYMIYTNRGESQILRGQQDYVEASAA